VRKLVKTRGLFGGAILWILGRIRRTRFLRLLGVQRTNLYVICFQLSGEFAVLTLRISVFVLSHLFFQFLVIFSVLDFPFFSAPLL